MTTQATERDRGPILIVDDDADQRACVAELLSLRGYAVVVACDGQDAMDQLSDGLRPLVIVLDLAMPRMDGWSFLERLRGPVHSTVPVLVTSATAAERPPQGADACMEKPLDCGAFSAIVARLFAGACAGGVCWDH